MTQRKPKTGSTLSIRDREIIEHVVRYRLTTNAVLRRTHLRGLSRSAAGKVIGRLCDLDLLQGFPLSHPSRYYVLSAEAARSFGVAANRSLALGPQSLPTEYAALVYATLGKEPRKRLTRKETLAICPWLPPALVQATHCLDETSSVLELLRVDLGGPADHVARKCLADINARRRFSEFLPFLRRGTFRLVLITTTPGKALALRQAIDRHDWPSELPIHFSIVSDLLSLTTRHHNA